MKKRWKKRRWAAAVLLLVCAAVYMNWRYTDDIQKNRKDPGSDHSGQLPGRGEGDGACRRPGGGRLFRHGPAQPQAGPGQRHQHAQGGGRVMKRPGECSQRGVPDPAGAGVYTVAESQIESLVTAKGYADCVVFMGAESVSVVVAAGGRPDCHRRRPHQGHRPQRDGLHRRSDQDHGGKLVVVFPEEKWYILLILGLY